MGLFNFKKSKKEEDFIDEIDEKEINGIEESSQKKSKKRNFGKLLISVSAVSVIAGAGYFAYVSNFNQDEMQARIEKAIQDSQNGNYGLIVPDLFERSSTFSDSSPNLKNVKTEPAVKEKTHHATTNKNLTAKQHKTASSHTKKEDDINDMKKIFSSVKEDSSKSHVKQITINPQKLAVPEKAEVKKDGDKVKIVFETKEQKDIKKLKREIDLIKKSLKTISRHKEIKKEILSEVDTKLMILKGTIRNSVLKEIAEIKDFVKNLRETESKNQKEIAALSLRLSKLESESKKTAQQIASINLQIKKLNDSLKNVNKDTIKRLESLVAELNKKTQDLQKLNQQITKIKQVFQDNIKANIKLAREFDSFKQKLALLENKVNGVINTKNTAIKNAQNGNIAETQNLTKNDYINTFGFYYAGYSESDGKSPTGYISDSSGKIYEVQIGDVINNRYKTVDIKPLYIKLKDLENGKFYVISYKQ